MAIGIPYSIGVAAAKSVSVTTFDLVTTAAVAPGDTVIVAIAHSSKSATGLVRSVTDSAGSTYQLNGTSGTSNDINQILARAAVPSGLPAGTTITFTISSAIVGYAASAFGAGGVLPTSDLLETGSNTSTTSITTRTSDPTVQADELLVAPVGARMVGTATPTPGTGFTLLQAAGTTGGTAATNYALFPQYRIVNAINGYLASMSGLTSVDKQILLVSLLGGQNPVTPPPSSGNQDQIVDLRAGYSRLPQTV